MPTAVVRFLERDSRTKQLAKPQLRGAEGQELTLNLGDQIPIVSTVFGAAAAGGFANIPQSSFTYKDVGVNITMTPRVTYEGEIVLDLTVESSNLGPNISVAGQAVPSFGSRRVHTRLRLREGESNLLAGLLRDDQRRVLQGPIGLMRVPGLRSIFGSTNDTITQTDIVMLLTPHIVRTHELTVDDLAPIYIGTQQNVGLGGPPPLIQSPLPEDPTAQMPAGQQMPAQPILTPTPQFLPPPRCAADNHCAAGRPGSAAAGGPCRPRHRRPARFRRCRLCLAERRRAPPRDPTAPPPPTTPDAPAGAAATQIGRNGAAGVPDCRRSVHRAAVGGQCLAAVDADGDRDVQSGGAARAQRAGRDLHAPGRRDGDVHAAHRRGHRPRRHRGHAQRRPRRRLGAGLIAALLFDAVGPGNSTDSDQRRGQHAGRRGDAAAVHAGVGDGEIASGECAGRACRP